MRPGWMRQRKEEKSAGLDRLLLLSSGTRSRVVQYEYGHSRRVLYCPRRCGRCGRCALWHSSTAENRDACCHLPSAVRCLCLCLCPCLCARTTPNGHCVQRPSGGDRRIPPSLPVSQSPSLPVSINTPVHLNHAAPSNLFPFPFPFLFLVLHNIPSTIPHG
ncbi:hypothetical protein EDC01DRAFT_261705 [Geopyxis carbonaria]|nr:hypothetical protein EDC01DRAFT_261705 [Geopyxis carbonaria]